MTIGGVVSGGTEDKPSWRVARHCESGACVQIGTSGESVLVSSSADPDSLYVAFSRQEWQEFVAGVKEGEFDGL